MELNNDYECEGQIDLYEWLGLERKFEAKPKTQKPEKPVEVIKPMYDIECATCQKKFYGCKGKLKINTLCLHKGELK